MIPVIKKQPPRLSAADIKHVANAYGLDPAVLYAVAIVESGRLGGFSTDGRPIILYEPHIFSRLTLRHYDGQVSDRISTPVWNPALYPKQQFERYKLLEQAAKLDPEAALKSCSWGLLQIMGFNHGLCDCTTVDLFVELMAVNEIEQLRLGCNFMRNSKLFLPLQAKNWSAFAKGYNGPDYARNKYDQKLATAYAAGQKLF